MSIPQLKNPKKLSYSGMRKQVRELARRMNILTEMKTALVEPTAPAKFEFSGDTATLDVPSVEADGGLVAENEDLQARLDECLEGGDADIDPIYEVDPEILIGANFSKVYNLRVYRQNGPGNPWCRNDITILLARYATSVKWASIVDWVGDGQSMPGTDTPFTARRNPGSVKDLDSKIPVYATALSGTESKSGSTDMSGYNLFTFTNGVELTMFDGIFDPENDVV